MGGYTEYGISIILVMVVICLQISNFEWVDTPYLGSYRRKNSCDLLTN